MTPEMVGEVGSIGAVGLAFLTYHLLKRKMSPRAAFGLSALVLCVVAIIPIFFLIFLGQQASAIRAGEYKGTVEEVINIKNATVVINLDGKYPGPCKHVFLSLVDNPSFRQIPKIGDVLDAKGMILENSGNPILVVTSPYNLLWDGKMTPEQLAVVPQGIVVDLPTPTKDSVY